MKNELPRLDWTVAVFITGQELQTKGNDGVNEIGI